MDIDKIREDTRACADIAHLNNAGASLMPHVVVDAIIEHIRLEETVGGYEAAEERANAINGFYTAAAQLLHCHSDEIAFTTNATDSYNCALSSIPFKAGDVILTTSNDYSSNHIAFLSLKKRFEIEIVKVRDTDDGQVDLADLDQKMKTYHPRLVAVTHIPTNSGLVQPIEGIGDIVKHYDSLFLIDACQTLGQLEVDVSRLHCDFLSGTMRKFLRGPRGAGLLFVSQKALAKGLEPLFPDMRGADWTSETEYTPRTTAKRFEDWEFAYSLLLGSKVAIEYANEIGLNKIEARNTLLRNYTRKKLNEIRGLELMDRGANKCNLITFHAHGQDPNRMKSELRRRKINVSITDRFSAVIDFDKKGIEWVIRISPHYFNTFEEIDRLVDGLNEIL